MGEQRQRWRTKPPRVEPCMEKSALHEVKEQSDGKRREGREKKKSYPVRKSFVELEQLRS